MRRKERSNSISPTASIFTSDRTNCVCGITVGATGCVTIGPYTKLKKLPSSKSARVRNSIVASIGIFAPFLVLSVIFSYYQALKDVAVKFLSRFYKCVEFNTTSQCIGGVSCFYLLLFFLKQAFNLLCGWSTKRDLSFFKLFSYLGKLATRLFLAFQQGAIFALPLFHLFLLCLFPHSFPCNQCRFGNCLCRLHQRGRRVYGRSILLFFPSLLRYAHHPHIERQPCRAWPSRV